MEPFVERMIKEYYELNDKIKKLSAFIGSDRYNCLPSDEKDDQVEQYHVMEIYRIVLSRRLKRQGYDVESCNEEDK